MAAIKERMTPAEKQGQSGLRPLHDRIAKRVRGRH